MSSNWVLNFLANYQPLSNTTNSSPGSEMPGSFPEELNEVIEPQSRNAFNSRNIKRHLTWAFNYIQVIIIKPLIFILYVLFIILSKFINLVYFRDHSRRKSNTNAVNGAINRSDKFIRDLAENLTADQSEQLLPPFFKGSYTQALYMATNKGKFLFVYLTNPENESYNSMFNKVIINEKFTSLFKDPNFIIWGGDLTNPESYQLANSLNVTKFPFLGLLSLTRNTTMTPEGPIKSSPKISLLLKIQGEVSDKVNVDNLIQNKFIKKIEKYEPELKLIRKDLIDKFINQVFLKQQDLNYQKSLENDRIKKLQKEYEKLKKEYLVWKLNWFKSIDVENSTESKAKIAIKLPSGERVTNVFLADFNISDIFDYIELYRNGYFSRNIDSLPIDESKFENFKPTYKFKVMSPLPPKVTLNDKLNDNIMIKDLNFIYPNGLLIVEDIE